VQHVVGKHEIDHSLQIDTLSKVLVVVAREAKADAVVEIHHGGDAIESEAVKPVFLHVKSQVAEQEAHGLVASIVEQSRVPELMATLGTLVEVLVVASIKVVESIEDVLAGVRVHDIEEDGDAESMCSVDQLLELLRGAFGRKIRLKERKKKERKKK